MSFDKCMYTQVSQFPNRIQDIAITLESSHMSFPI